LRRANFNNDKVDAGDIGAGHQVTALYEITPVGSPARMTEPLRYGAPISQNSQPGIAFVTLRYKRPGETQSQRINAPVGAPESFDADDDLRFAAAIARFGQLLRDPRYMGT
jgi:Ca-activated chloride channel family protein